MLTNIQDAKWTLTLYCNAGRAIVTQKGDLKGYETVMGNAQGSNYFLSLHTGKRVVRNNWTVLPLGRGDIQSTSTLRGM